MLLAQKLAGFSKGDADELRKAMGKNRSGIGPDEKNVYEKAVQKKSSC
jgi:DNA polymerase-3 subunit alpha